MKYLRMFEYYNQLEAELAKYNIINYTINNDGTIDVNGDVNLHKNLTEIPFQFGKVEGHFSCSYNNLISLEGCPKYVGDWFECQNNQLTSLEYAPKYVGYQFNCQDNDIRYIPPDLYIEGSFYIKNNPIFIIFNHNIPDKKIILEELSIYNPISKNGKFINEYRLKDMYRELGLLNKFDSDIKRLPRYYKIV